MRFSVSFGKNEKIATNLCCWTVHREPWSTPALAPRESSGWPQWNKAVSIQKFEPILAQAIPVQGGHCFRVVLQSLVICSLSVGASCPAGMDVCSRSRWVVIGRRRSPIFQVVGDRSRFVAHSQFFARQWTPTLPRPTLAFE